MNVSIETYGNYTNKNYGTNCMRVQLGSFSVWFSYYTPVAFYAGSGRIVRENDWGPTTGRHLNMIDNGDKASRVPGDKWEELFRAACERHSITV